MKMMMSLLVPDQQIEAYLSAPRFSASLRVDVQIRIMISIKMRYQSTVTVITKVVAHYHGCNWKKIPEVACQHEKALPGS